MSDLEKFRDYCRERVNWQRGEPRAACKDRTAFDTPKPPDHANCGGGSCGCRCHEPTSRDRGLFRRLAREIDTYLADEIDAHLSNDDEPLWGEPE